MTHSKPRRTSVVKDEPLEFPSAVRAVPQMDENPVPGSGACASFSVLSAAVRAAPLSSAWIPLQFSG